MKIKSFKSAIILLIAIFFSLGVYAQQETEIYNQVDIPSYMPMEKQALSDFIFANVVYPVDAVGSGISGMVMVRFVVELNGTISNIQIERNVHPLLDAEAIRVIGSIPGKWTPAKMDGVSVRSYSYLPVILSDPGK